MARSPRLSNVTVAVLSGRRRDRDRDPGHPCCPGRWFREFAGRARNQRRRARPRCCRARACADRGHNRMLRDGRAPSPSPASAGHSASKTRVNALKVRDPASSFARSRARSCRSAAPPPRRQSRICASWMMALLSHLGPTPGLARRSLGATATSTPPARNAAAAGLIAGRHGLCRILARARGAWGEHTWLTRATQKRHARGAHP